MSEARLDQIVKGAPSPYEGEKSQPSILPLPGVSPTASDPLASLPSSPPQIYLNLLILEASLRSQFLALQSRRQQHTFFITLLTIWTAYFSYALFLAPREDGSGVGGSIYWVIESVEKVAFMGGIVTGVLVWGTGQWERGVRWPRRWVGVTNRGLRSVNLKIVLVKGSFWREAWHNLKFIFPWNWGVFFIEKGSGYRHIDAGLASELEKGSHKHIHNHALSGLATLNEEAAPKYLEEDLAPGGDTLKLLLLPKPFSPAFRENWDLYRSQYWEAENERRRLLRIKLSAQDKLLAKQKRKEWWLSRFRFRPVRNLTGSSRDIEKVHHQQHHHLQHSGSLRGSDKEKRTRSSSLRASQSTGSHSRNSSRSSTPAPATADDADLPTRRGSTASTSSVDSRRTRKKKQPISSVQKMTPASTSTPSSTPFATTQPEHPSPLVRQNSIGGSSTESSSRPSTPAGLDDRGSVRSLRMSSPGGSPARKATK